MSRSTNQPAVVDGAMVLAQLRREVAEDKGWAYTEYEQGRIAEKRRCISLLEDTATQPGGSDNDR